MKNPALGFILLIFLASCASQSPVVPEAPADPVAPPELSEPSHSPLSPSQARAALSEQGIPYSQLSFLTAASRGDLAVVRLFVQAGMAVDVQTADLGYDTALMWAAGGGHLAVVKYLVSQDDPSKAHYNQLVRLTNGRCAGSLAMDLGDYDGNCNEQDALMWAAWGGHVQVADYLLEEGAVWRDMSWSSLGRGPNSAIQLAAYAGHADVVRLLLEHVTYIRDGLRFINGGAYAMNWAAYGGQLEVVRILLGHGVKLNPGDELSGQRGKGVTALMRAAEGGHPEVVLFLLDRGADLFVMQAREWMDEEGNIYRELSDTALTLAIIHGHDEVIAALLTHWVYTHGADGRDDVGRTTLMYAAAWGNVETMQNLIDNDAPIQAKSHTGYTALMFAAEWGHIDAVKLLLDLGADPTARNSYEHTALSLAVKQGHTQIAALLEE